MPHEIFAPIPPYVILWFYPQGSCYNTLFLLLENSRFWIEFEWISVTFCVISAAVHISILETSRLWWMLLLDCVNCNFSYFNFSVDGTGVPSTGIVQNLSWPISQMVRFWCGIVLLIAISWVSVSAHKEWRITRALNIIKVSIHTIYIDSLLSFQGMTKIPDTLVPSGQTMVPLNKTWPKAMFYPWFIPWLAMNYHGRPKTTELVDNLWSTRIVYGRPWLISSWLDN